ncbi:hypothetical protein RvY_16834 [Ramazzottius varieornatus]|uniref:Uncharacterized protein n=1 Tax=Ramazzottius varieornatus TaxID=947166 RepID=A0A1D1W0Y0_RAMVA|nr:hypothetical protein RvY_16834 [Ramazzottius varieornatus]
MTGIAGKITHGGIPQNAARVVTADGVDLTSAFTVTENGEAARSILSELEDLQRKRDEILKELAGETFERFKYHSLFGKCGDTEHGSCGASDNINCCLLGAHIPYKDSSAIDLIHQLGRGLLVMCDYLVVRVIRLPYLCTIIEGVSYL